jgi:hypothetical protein
MPDAAAPEPARQTIIGLLVDVSYSMRTSLRNDTGGTMSRLDGWAAAVRKAAERDEAAERAGRDPAPAETNPARVFAYALGTRQIGPVNDLLTLLRLTDGRRADDHPDESRPFRSGDPYYELRTYAREHGLEGWSTWIENSLSDTEAATLAANLRDSPRLRRELAGALPPMTEHQIKIAQNSSPWKVVFGGPGYTYQAAKLSVDARRYNYRDRAAEAEQIVRRIASRRMTYAEILVEAVAEAAPTTLTVPELAAILTRRAAAGEIDSTLDEFLYGNTPLTAAVQEAAKRFLAEREPDRPDPHPLQGLLLLLVGIAWVVDLLETGKPKNILPPSKPKPVTTEVLFIVSDGLSTDGDPGEAIARLHRSGVTVVCCYVGATDIVDDARRLPVVEDPGWDDGARQLFDCASLVPDGTYREHLREKGWHIPEGSRLFFQANHSSVLAEISELVLRQNP